MHRKHQILNQKSIDALLKNRFRGEFLGLKDLPHPNTFKDMDRAVNRLVEAIKSNEKIVVVGDYDVDGVTATSIMRLFFDEIGYKAEWIIPNRFTDGYGVSTTILERIDESVSVIVTVDNGISAIEAANECKKRGIDLIITDHHIVPSQKPKAYAIIDQKQLDCTFPHQEVCGAQIAWYLCAALNRAIGADISMQSYIEFTALAIIADIMPLKHINRAMVERGLVYLNNSNRAFMRAWRERFGNSILKADDIAFKMAPMLNSAGRLEDAKVACDYLCTQSIEEARVLLDELVDLNERRKTLESDITKEALEIVDDSKPVAVVASEDWHEGVVGIVAARVARKLEKPSIVLTGVKEYYKGSGRTFGDCHLYNLIDRHRDMLHKFGGHSAAIGMSIKRSQLNSFIDAISADAIDICALGIYEDPDILGILNFNNIDFELYDILQKYEPYGEANPRPKFISRDVNIIESRAIGAEKNHCRYKFEQYGVYIDGIEFRTDIFIPPKSRVDILYTVTLNSFRGEDTIQLLIEKIEIKD